METLRDPVSRSPSKEKSMRKSVAVVTLLGALLTGGAIGLALFGAAASAQTDSSSSSSAPSSSSSSDSSSSTSDSSSSSTAPSDSSSSSSDSSSSAPDSSTAPDP